MTTERMYKSLIPFISFIGFPIILIATICGFSVDVLAEKKSDHLKVDLAEYLREPIQKGMSPGLIAAIIDENGVRAIGAVGVRKYGSSEKLTVNDRVHIGSNTKAMTSTMLATLVEDGTFVDGWKTTIADVFPELLKKIHKDYHSVELSQLLRMKGGIAVNTKDWWAYS